MGRTSRGVLPALALLIGLAACGPDPGSPAAAESSVAAALAPAEALPARTRTPAPASFDYWVLALSWSPEYCASDEARPGSRQCSRPREFVVHGLWPQYERGYPQSCDSQARVSERTADALTELMPDRGLVYYQWRKHGSCSGLDVDTYFARLQQAARRIVIPREAIAASTERSVDPRDLERAFITANPGLTASSMVLDCRRGYLREVRFCLDSELRPRTCGTDLREGCGRRMQIRASAPR